MTVELRSGDGAAVVLGGPYLTVSSWRQAGRELLVGPEALPADYRVHETRAGITLLHPWANRLGPGAVSVDGRALEFDLGDESVGRDPNGLPIHGLASATGWSLTATSAQACHASVDQPAVKPFPFPHRVDVRIALAAGPRLTIETTVSCADDAEVPVAFGWHPYFRVEPASRVELALPDREHLGLDRLGLPTGSRRAEAHETVRLFNEGLDDAYTGIAEGAVFSLRAAGERIDVVPECGFDSAQVFAPLDAPVVSLEPMTAPTDALRSGQGLKFARRGQPFSARFSIRVSGARPGAGQRSPSSTSTTS